MRAKGLYKSPLFWGCFFSVILLALFLSLQAKSSRLIGLPVQWIWLSVIPIFLALVAGGYIGKFKAPGFEFERGIRNLPYYPPVSGEDLPRSGSEPSRSGISEKADVDSNQSTKIAEDLTQERDKEMKRTDCYFLLHVCEPSRTQGQKYDIRIFIIRHVQGPEPNQKAGFIEIDKAEFYFGSSWGKRVFTAKNDGGFIGVSTSAWGTFLATCRLTFKDANRPPVILYRYVDFEMAPQPTR
jgi:hypothetical protein